MLEPYIYIAMFVGFPAACITALSAYLWGKLLGSGKAAMIGALMGALIGVPAWLFFVIFALTDEGWAFFPVLLAPFLQIGGGTALLSGVGATTARYLDPDNTATLMVTSGALAFATSILIARHVLGALQLSVSWIGSV